MEINDIAACFNTNVFPNFSKHNYVTCRYIPTWGSVGESGYVCLLKNLALINSSSILFRSAFWLFLDKSFNDDFEAMLSNSLSLLASFLSKLSLISCNLLTYAYTITDCEFFYCIFRLRCVFLYFVLYNISYVWRRLPVTYKIWDYLLNSWSRVDFSSAILFLREYSRLLGKDCSGCICFLIVFKYVSKPRFSCDSLTFSLRNHCSRW